MTMVNMKINSGGVESVEPNPYGYGLTICLTEEQVKLLGLDKNPPPAGATVGLRAIAAVKRVTQEADVGEAAEGAEGDIDVALEIQITDLEVTPEGALPAAQASLLYGGNG